MRRVFLLSLMMLLAPIVTAQADPIDLGFISFDNLIPSDGDVAGINGFTIGNFTGDPATGGFALPPDFLVFTPILFSNSTMTVVEGSTSTSFLLGNLGPGFFLPDALQFLTSAQISSATFFAEIGPLVFTLANGTTYESNAATVSATLLPSSGAFLSAGLDLALLTIDADPQVPPPTGVPEPQTLLMVGSGIAILAGWRRRRRDRSM